MQNTYIVQVCEKYIYKANNTPVVVIIGFSLGAMARPKKSNSGYNRGKDK